MAKLGEVKLNYDQFKTEVKQFKQTTSPSKKADELPIVTSPGGAELVNGDFSSPNFVSGNSGWNLTSTGNLEANNGNFRGDITGASGTFGGSLIAGNIHIPDQDATASSFHVDTTGAVWIGATETNRATAPFIVTAGGAITATGATITGVMTISATSSGIANFSDAGDLVTVDESAVNALNLTNGPAAANADVTKTIIDAGLITTGYLTLGTAGNIKSGQTAYDTGTGFWLGNVTGTPKFSIGIQAGNKMLWDGTDLTINGSTITNPVLTGIASGSEIAIQGWQSDLTFSATDLDTVAWTSGTITILDGTTYSIDAGNTGNMAAITYIYLNTAASITVLQTTTTPATAVGSGKIIVAVAENKTDEAFFQVFGGTGGVLLSGDSIAANAIVANNINVTNLAAVSADMGSLTAGDITLDSSGYIRGGQTDYATGTGFYLGYSDDYKFSIGNSTDYLTWDGIDLTISGYIANADFLPSYNAYKALTIGDPVKIITDSGVDKFAPVEGISTETTFYTSAGSQTGTVMGMCRLTSTKVVFVWAQANYVNTGLFYAKIGIESNGSITWYGTQTLKGSTGELYKHYNSWNNSIVVKRVSDTAFVFGATHWGSTTAEAKPWLLPCTVSGATITTGTIDYLGYPTWGGQSTEADLISVVNNEDGSITCTVYVENYWANSYVDNNTVLFVCTMNEGDQTLTKGAETIISTTRTTVARVHLLSENRILTVYETNKYDVHTISGTTLTEISSGSTITDATETFEFKKGNTDNQGIAMLSAGASQSLVKLVESAGTVTTSLTTAASYTDSSTMTIDKIIDYEPTTKTWFMRSMNYLVHETDSSIDDIYDGGGIANSTSVTESAICYLDQQKIVVVNMTVAGGGYVTLKYVVASLDWGNIVGFADSTVAADVSVSANVNGRLEKNQSGLNPGFTYYVGADGLLQESSTSTVNSTSFTNQKVGIAYSATNLIVSI